MARVLAISSFVAHGHVGLSAIVPALQAMGHEVIAVPTVILSNHYGYQHVGGMDVPIDAFKGMMTALQANTWLSGLDAVVTGYLPSTSYVEALEIGLGRLSEANPDILYLCDPVLGDDPGGLYVEEDLATAIRDRLVALADVITPNRFELSWLSGINVTSAADAVAAADALGEDLVTVATSVPGEGKILSNVLVTDMIAGHAVTLEHKDVPHGTGDLFASLLLGHLLDGHAEQDAVARATAGVRNVVEASIGAEELGLVEGIRAAVLADQPFSVDGFDA